MAGLKDLERRIKSVKNTKKTTYAMKLVSAAKLRKAQEAVTRAREYTSSLYGLIATLQRQQENSELTHPLLEVRPVRRILLLVIGGSRGLAGGYNSNVNRRVEAAYRELRAEHPGVEIDARLIGRKVGEFFRRSNRPYLSAEESYGEEPLTWPIREFCNEIAQEFAEGRYDRVYLIYTKFRSAISVTATSEQVLPLQPTTTQNVRQPGPQGLVLFEPSPEAVFSSVIPRVFSSIVLQAALDAKASEHGSRMTAMDSATKNASELIDKLELKRNKLRQSVITSQLLDILGGSEAIK